MNILAIYGKFFPIGTDRVLNIDLAINSKSLIIPLVSSNIVYLYFLHITIEAGHY